MLIQSSCGLQNEHFITIFTARKRRLRRLCFYTCLSFCSQGGTPNRYSPLQVHPPGRYPQAGTPPSRYTPRQVHTLGRYTRRQVHLPAMHAGIQSTSGRYASYWNAFLLSPISIWLRKVFQIYLDHENYCASRS